MCYSYEVQLTATSGVMSLQETAKEIRKSVLSMIFRAQSSHIGSNLSCIEVLTAIFAFADKDRDELVVSKGWAAASVYALDAHHEIIPKEDLFTFNQEGSKYIGLIEPIGIFGCKVGSGSMGHGLPMAIGHALAFQKEKLTLDNPAMRMVYVVMSDGEMDCGTTWESALIAKHHMLNNLMVFVDVNGWQAMGKTTDVLDQGSLAQKWSAFGWNVFEIDGHSFPALNHALETGRLASPTVVLCYTTKGKGVSFMEDKLVYHYKNLSKEEYDLATAELV